MILHNLLDRPAVYGGLDNLRLAGGVVIPVGSCPSALALSKGPSSISTAKSRCS
jgi:hypothetical protein